jgi:hypothetical protein
MQANHFSPTFLILFFFLQCSCTSSEGQGKETIKSPLETTATPKKQKNKGTANTLAWNGVSFVSPSNEIGKLEIEKPAAIISANALCFMPYGFISENSTDLKFDSHWQWWGEKTDGTTAMIRLAKEAGYRIMLKPHVWKDHGAFTGNHAYETSEQWTNFEKSYSAYILNFAAIAEVENVTLFCIGTEWGDFVKERPEYWTELISEIRKIYSGQLTYAANWDEYERVPFWDQLDFIGVDAYFPLTKATTPLIEELEFALAPFSNRLKYLSDSLGKKVLFTEYGFRSRDNATFKPWESDRGGEVNMQTQLNAYQAFYNTFWNRDFIAGGFLWKWFSNHEDVGGSENSGFTPQNKPVEKLIKKVHEDAN